MLKPLLTSLKLLILGAGILLGTITAPVLAQNLTPNELLPTFEYTDGNQGKVNYVSQLPSGSWQSILINVIKIILAVAGSLAFISFTVSGIMMVAARGEEDLITKAKHNIVWSIIALLVIATSYAVVLGISQLSFF